MITKRSENPTQQESGTKECYLFLVLKCKSVPSLYGMTDICLSSEEENNTLIVLNLCVEQDYGNVKWSATNRSENRQVDQESVNVVL